MKTEHILVIRFSAMGDVAMTVPVIQSLAKQYPKVRITVLVVPLPVLSLKTWLLTLALWKLISRRNTKG